MISEFPTFKSALDHIIVQEAARAHHAFTVTYCRTEHVIVEIDEQLRGHAPLPRLASTLAEWAVNPDNVGGLAVGSEAHYGYILAHYSPEGVAVRFFSII